MGKPIDEHKTLFIKLPIKTDKHLPPYQEGGKKINSYTMVFSALIH